VIILRKIKVGVNKMENEIYICQSCGEKNPVSNNFCQKCAAPLRSTPIKSTQQIQQESASQNPLKSEGKEKKGNYLDSKKLKYLAGVLFGIYFLIITGKTFAKPSGWSMWPYKWQESWHPNYFLYIILIVSGIATVIVGYIIFNKNNKK
jgi:hypothetical protein